MTMEGFYLNLGKNSLLEIDSQSTTICFNENVDMKYFSKSIYMASDKQVALKAFISNQVNFKPGLKLVKQTGNI